MVAHSRKSKRQSDGSGHSLSRPDDFTFYLDENLCNTKSILETLTKLGVHFERHLDHFARGTPDETWLPLVGKNSWVLLTADKRIRYNFLEKRAHSPTGIATVLLFDVFKLLHVDHRIVDIVNALDLLVERKWCKATLRR
jgi:PIN like domain